MIELLIGAATAMLFAIALILVGRSSRWHPDEDKLVFFQLLSRSCGIVVAASERQDGSVADSRICRSSPWKD